jgi:hypothetical protein
MKASPMIEFGGPLWLKMAMPAAFRGRFTSVVEEDRETRPSGGIPKLHRRDDLTAHIQRHEENWAS